MKHTITIALLFLLTTNILGQSLSLDSCKMLALENNKRVKEAQMKVDASKQVKKNAFTNYFPKISASAFAMRTNKPLLDLEVPEMNLPVYDGNPVNLATASQFSYFPGMAVQALDYTNTAMLTAIQPLYTGGRIRNGNKLASLGEEVNEEMLELSTDEVILKTEEYYWMIVSLENKKLTLEKYQALLTSLLKDVEVANNVGLVQKSDLLKVQLKMNEIEANKLKLDNGISLLKMTMAQHIGIEYTDSLMVSDSTLNLNSPEAFYTDPKNAMQNRSEYILLNKSVEAEKIQGKMSRGEYMPSLAVGVAGMYLDVMEKQNFYGVLFATVSVPISDWWGGMHKHKEHKIKVDIAKNNLDEKSELLMLQMDKTYKDLNESYKQVSIAELGSEQAKEHLKVMDDNYKAGVVNTSDLLEAQAIYQQSEDALVDAKTIYKIKLAYYRQATAQKNI